MATQTIRVSINATGLWRFRAVCAALTVLARLGVIDSETAVRIAKRALARVRFTVLGNGRPMGTFDPGLRLEVDA